MIDLDDNIEDPVGAAALLALYFEPDDVVNELAHQVFAELAFYGRAVWDFR
jgi:hypothetical protein